MTDENKLRIAQLCLNRGVLKSDRFYESEDPVEVAKAFGIQLSCKSGSEYDHIGDVIKLLLSSNVYICEYGAMRCDG